MKTDKLPILITAIGGGGHGEQILKALRMADCDRYRIVGADMQPNCPQFDLTDDRIVFPRATDPSYMDFLLNACDRFQIKALFHGCEPELKLFSRERERIIQRGIFLPINPPSVIDLCMNKEETNRFLRQEGFAAPKFVRAQSIEDLRGVDWFPVVVKPSVGGGGSANVFIAQTQSELMSLTGYLGLDEISNHFLIQEYVGTPDDEYTVGVLHDMDGRYLNSIAVKRLLSGQLNIRMSVPNRAGRAELGAKLVVSSGVSHGYVGRFPEVTQQCKNIAAAIGAKGPLNIQCRFVQGKVIVFEINPRFSGTTSIRAMVGYNEPDILLRRHVFGEAIPIDFSYDEALILRNLAEKRVRDSL